VGAVEFACATDDIKTTTTKSGAEKQYATDCIAGFPGNKFKASLDANQRLKTCKNVHTLMTVFLAFLHAASADSGL